MRGNCDLFIELDLSKALEQKMKVYKSKNGVILTSGFKGFVPKEFFKKVIDDNGNLYYENIETNWEIIDFKD